MQSRLILSGILVVLFIACIQAYPDCENCGVCQSHYKPVCGADGITYGNACQLGCEKSCRQPGLKIVHDGECGNPTKYTH